MFSIGDLHWATSMHDCFQGQAILIHLGKPAGHTAMQDCVLANCKLCFLNKLDKDLIIGKNVVEKTGRRWGKGGEKAEEG